jgi:hypothetical protein
MHFSVRWNVALLPFLTLIHGWELRNLNHRRQRLWMKWSGRVSVRPGPVSSEHRCTMTKVLWRENTVAAMDRVKTRLVVVPPAISRHIRFSLLYLSRWRQHPLIALVFSSCVYSMSVQTQMVFTCVLLALCIKLDLLARCKDWAGERDLCPLPFACATDFAGPAQLNQAVRVPLSSIGTRAWDKSPQLFSRPPYAMHRSPRMPSPAFWIRVCFTFLPYKTTHI